MQCALATWVRNEDMIRCRHLHCIHGLVQAVFRVNCMPCGARGCLAVLLFLVTQAGIKYTRSKDVVITSGDTYVMRRSSGRCHQRREGHGRAVIGALEAVRVLHPSLKVNTPSDLLPLSMLHEILPCT